MRRSSEGGSREGLDVEGRLASPLITAVAARGPSFTFSILLSPGAKFDSMGF